MKPNIYIKNLSRFCATTILIMSFTHGIATYLLSLLNMVAWITVTIIERRKLSESDSTDASKWYSRYGRKLLTDLITDLNTRGIKRPPSTSRARSESAKTSVIESRISLENPHGSRSCASLRMRDSAQASTAIRSSSHGR